MAKKKTEWEKKCKICKGYCCNYLALDIDKPTTKHDFDNIRWYLLHEKTAVMLNDDGKWTLQFETPCRQLGEDYKCKIYKTRPLICKEYPGKNFCEYEGELPPYKTLFTTDKQIRAYMKKKGFK